MIRNFKQLLEQAIKKGPVRVALAASLDEAALSALLEANRIDLARARLFGDRERTMAVLEKLNASPKDFLDVLHFPQDELATKSAVLSVKCGQSDILLKGNVKTSLFLRSVLDPDNGLRAGRLLSDVFIFEDMRLDNPQLRMITDGGVNPAPDLQQKIEILHNAVEVAHKLGNDCPKVAVLSAVETVQTELPSTFDAALLSKMNQRSQITGCEVEGPLALDNAVSPDAAKHKKLDSPVAGRADILLCPNIEAANMLAKGTTYFAGFRLAHVIMGATAPILIPSRADSADAKLMSIALGTLVRKTSQ